MAHTRCHSDHNRCIIRFTQLICSFHHVDTFLRIGRLEHCQLGGFCIISVVLLILRRKHSRVVGRYQHVSCIYPHICPGKQRVCCHVHTYMLHRNHTSCTCNGRSDSGLHCHLFVWRPLCIYLIISCQILKNLCTRCSRISGCVTHTSLISTSCDCFIACH